MDKELLVGLSLSQCIKDIIEDKVSEDQVLLIVAGTNHNLKNPQLIMEYYKNTDWRADPQYAEHVLTRFIHEGKIIQPREFGLPYHNISRGHWAVVSVLTTQWVRG